MGNCSRAQLSLLVPRKKAWEVSQGNTDRGRGDRKRESLNADTEEERGESNMSGLCWEEPLGRAALPTQ